MIHTPSYLNESEYQKFLHIRFPSRSEPKPLPETDPRFPGLRFVKGNPKLKKTDPGHTAMLQDYTDFIYLRVEDKEGAGVTKIAFDRQGNGSPERQVDYPPQTDLDRYFVTWAQNIISMMKDAA